MRELIGKTVVSDDLKLQRTVRCFLRNLAQFREIKSVKKCVVCIMIRSGSEYIMEANAPIV